MVNQVTVEPGARSLAARVRCWFTGVGPHPGAGTSQEGTGLIAPGAVTGLQDAWRRHSLATGWFNAADWWDPACEAVVEQILTDDAHPPGAIARLGRARAELGCTIEESLDDLAALYAAAGLPGPPLAAVRALAGGWAEAGLDLGTSPCVDPVTGLASRAYLQARLGEFYRDARPGHPADHLCLVVVDVDVPAALNGLLALHRTGETLRRTFTHGHPIARISQGRFIAVAAIGSELATGLTALEGALAGADSVAAVWVESLPRTYALVPGLLDDLGR